MLPALRRSEPLKQERGGKDAVEALCVEVQVTAHVSLSPLRIQRPAADTNTASSGSGATLFLFLATSLASGEAEFFERTRKRHGPHSDPSASDNHEQELLRVKRCVSHDLPPVLEVVSGGARVVFRVRIPLAQVDARLAGLAPRGIDSLLCGLPRAKKSKPRLLVAPYRERDLIDNDVLRIMNESA